MKAEERKSFRQTAWSASWADSGRASRAARRGGPPSSGASSCWRWSSSSAAHRRRHLGAEELPGWLELDMAASRRHRHPHQAEQGHRPGQRRPVTPGPSGSQGRTHRTLQQLRRGDREVETRRRHLRSPSQTVQDHAHPHAGMYARGRQGTKGWASRMRPSAATKTSPTASRTVPSPRRPANAPTTSRATAPTWKVSLPHSRSCPAAPPPSRS